MGVGEVAVAMERRKESKAADARISKWSRSCNDQSSVLFQLYLLFCRNLIGEARRGKYFVDFPIKHRGTIFERLVGDSAMQKLRQ